MRISVTDGTHTIIYKLNDSPSAKSLYAMLPIDVGVENCGSNEKIFYPEQPIDTTGGIEGGGEAVLPLGKRGHVLRSLRQLARIVPSGRSRRRRGSGERSQRNHSCGGSGINDDFDACLHDHEIGEPHAHPAGSDPGGAADCRQEYHRCHPLRGLQLSGRRERDAPLSRRVCAEELEKNNAMSEGE